MSKSIEEILESRRQKNKEILKKKERALYDKSEEFRLLTDRIKELNIQRLKALMANQEYQSITDEIDRLRGEKKLCVKKLGFSEDYLKLTYDCEICKDTGFYKQKSCICRNKLISERLYDQSMIHNIIQKENFDNFNPNLFRKNRQADEPVSPYENILSIKKEIERFLDKPPSRLPNFYFYGDVGTGKTYMINCIAKELMDRGVEVLYQSSNDMLNFLASYQFMYQEDKKANQAKARLIYDVDVLIIDDLGTEHITEVIKSNLFELINKRLVAGKTTIISSNIAIFDLQMYYEKRISSRIMGNCEPVYFYGNDLRMANL